MPAGEERELPGWLAVESARVQVLAGVEPLPAVEVPIADAQGRVTARPLLTPADTPPFDASAMDGFAVRSADCPDQDGGEAGLTVVGESSAGAPWDGSLDGGQAVSISTGAEVPTGADAVVRVEDTVRNDDSVIVRAATAAGQNIRRRGEAMAAGSEVLLAGSRIGPVELGLLASTGNDPVLCHSRPTVSIVATGDELVPPGEPLGPGQIWNSNLAVISAMARAAGAEVVSTTSIGDSKPETEAALEAGPRLRPGCRLRRCIGRGPRPRQGHARRPRCREGLLGDRDEAGPADLVRDARRHAGSSACPATRSRRWRSSRFSAHPC